MDGEDRVRDWAAVGARDPWLNSAMVVSLVCGVLAIGAAVWDVWTVMRWDWPNGMITFFGPGVFLAAMAVVGGWIGFLRAWDDRGGRVWVGLVVVGVGVVACGVQLMNSGRT